MANPWNVILGMPIYSDDSAVYTPSYSGGGWANAPLSNLKTREVSHVARSTNASLSNTKFDCNLVGTRPVRAVGLINHNLSLAAKVRVRGFLEQVPVLDSTTFDAGWAPAGTPSRTAAAHTASGMPLDLLGDDSGAAAEGYTRGVVFVGNGTKRVIIRVKKGTSPPSSGGSIFYVTDSTASVQRLEVTITFDGSGVPTANVSVGTLVSYTHQGDGAYDIEMLTTSITAVNTHIVQMYAADVVNSGNIYVGNFQVFNGNGNYLAVDTGFVDAYPSYLTTVVAGVSGAERLALLTRKDWIHAFAAEHFSSIYRFEIDDTTNPDGWVEVGRAPVCGGFQPEVNMSAGARFTHIDHTIRNQRPGGTAYYEVLPQQRMASFQISRADHEEAMGEFYPLMRENGISGQMLFIWDPTDAFAFQNSYFGTFKEPSVMEQVVATDWNIPITIIEEI